ncbi:MAG: RHS repeat domain-containing protein [Pseudomonadota bacterium]
MRPSLLRPMSGVVSLALTTLVCAQTVQNTTYTYQYDANGNMTQITDPLSHVTNQTYDALNRLKLQTQPAPVTGAARPAIGYTYDGLDQLSTVTDPRQLVTTYANDGLGNQNTLTSPDTKVTIQTYDLAGNVKTSKDARGKLTTYKYDALNRVTLISYASGAATTFEYDGGPTGAPNAKGHLTKMTDESGTTSYSYDAFGRLRSKVQNSLALSSTYGSTGTATGKLTSMTYPSGNRINVSYDTAGRVTALTLNPTNANGVGTSGSVVSILKNIVYQPFGGPASWTWGNGAPYVRTFDLDGRLTSFPLGHAGKSGTVRTLGYDAAGRITSISHTGAGTGAAAPAGFNQGYGYDNLDRLSSVTGNISQGFKYDATGNRTGATFGSASYVNAMNAQSNRLASTTGPLPAKANLYDEAGNLTSDGRIGYTYSARGRMSSATIGSSVVSYTYNGIDQRISKNGPVVLVDKGQQQYMYDESGHLIGEYFELGNSLQEIVYLGDQPVAVLKQTVTGSAPTKVTATQLYYIYADQIDTSRVITRATDNTMAWRWDATDPFGLQPPNENPAGLGVFTYNPRFPGQLYDRETNLYYNYYRDYDPQTGRYLQSDPIGLRGGINIYSYGLGNPVSNSDPMGLFVPLIIPGVCAAGGCEAAAAAAAAGAAWWAAQHPVVMPPSSPIESRASGEEKLPIVNPGRDCDGNCNPCPPGKKWFVPKPGHGHDSGYWHTIIYNQDKKTCICYPDRPSGGLDGF